VRTSAVILDGDLMCLIRRRRRAGDQYSVPGGLVNQFEPILAALTTEFDEELGLKLAAIPGSAELRWIQDQIVTRPGTTALFRRLHLLRLPSHLRSTLAREEKDAKDNTEVVWMDHRRAGRPAPRSCATDSITAGQLR
jgi:8-oxo-dGTP pyrophosphatase MutT (NUDIX family)